MGPALAEAGTIPSADAPPSTDRRLVSEPAARADSHGTEGPRGGRGETAPVSARFSGGADAVRGRLVCENRLDGSAACPP